MKKVLATLLALSLLFTAGCTTTQLGVPTESTAEVLAEENFPLDEDYFTSQFETPGKYLFFLENLFFTLLPLCQRDKDLGLGQYKEIFAYEEEHFKGQPDELTIGDINYRLNSRMPVFYGLLVETANYLRAQGVNYDHLAAPYGKAHAIKCRDLQEIINLLLHKETPLSFASVAGAEYVEEAELFVYDELENPYQKLIDKGYDLEFVGSSMEFDKDYPWGGPFATCSADIPIWYDSATGYYYDPYGELLGFTHNIEGLRAEFEGELILYSSVFNSDKELKTHYHINVYFVSEKAIDPETPIRSIQCGSVTTQFGGGSYNELPIGYVPPEEEEYIGDVFFCNYYKDGFEEKPSNYLLSSFYSDPRELDLSLLPTQDAAELETWCRTYFGISADELTGDKSLLGTKTCETPYFSIQTAEAEGDLIKLFYYNEILRQEAIVTLQKAGDSYIILSNLPDYLQ